MAQKVVTSNPAIITASDTNDNVLVFKELKRKKVFTIEIVSGSIKIHSGYETNSDSPTLLDGNKIVVTAGKGIGDGYIHFKANVAGQSFRISY